MPVPAGLPALVLACSALNPAFACFLLDCFDESGSGTRCCRGNRLITGFEHERLTESHNNDPNDCDSTLQRQTRVGYRHLCHALSSLAFFFNTLSFFIIYTFSCLDVRWAHYKTAILQAYRSCYTCDSLEWCVHARMQAYVDS